MNEIVLPLLDPDLSAIEAMETLTGRRARAAVVENDGKYRLLHLDDIGRALNSNYQSRLNDVMHRIIETEHVVGRHTMLEVTLSPPRDIVIAMHAPLYVCLPDRDYSSTSPTAVCPTHNRKVQKEP